MRSHFALTSGGDASIDQSGLRHLMCGMLLRQKQQGAVGSRYSHTAFLLKTVLALQVLGKSGYPKQKDSVMLRPAQLLQLSPAELQMLHHHHAHVEAWGWQFAQLDFSPATGAVVTHAAAVLGTPLNSTELQVVSPRLSHWGVNIACNPCYGHCFVQSCHSA